MIIDPPLFIFTSFTSLSLLNFSINHSSNNKKMKWGRKKSALPSSSSSSFLFNRVFPVSWFSKSKQEGDANHESKNKQKCIFEFPTPKPSGLREGRFYSMDEDDAFWRLSFRDERIQGGRTSTGGINPLWNDDCEPPFSDFTSFESTNMEVEECMNFNQMVSDIKKMKERRGKQRIVAEKSRKFDDGEEKISNSGERDIFPVNMVCESRKQHKKDQKLKEIKIKPDSKKKHAYINRGVKSYSPRTECKIRALEEMKRVRMKSKKKEGVFDSFAVAKSSFDPERDFRDSMVEMIREKGIGHPEDLEELLACYLTLNCDEYHDMIIKVFRQVWFELKGAAAYMDPPTQNGVCFDH